MSDECSNFDSDSAEEDSFAEGNRLISQFIQVHPNSSQPTHAPRRSNSLTLAEQPQRKSTSSGPMVCVVCRFAISNAYPTCGSKCASSLQADSGLPSPNLSRISGPPYSTFMSSPPPSLWPSVVPSGRSGLESTAYDTGSQSHQPTSNQLKMCDVCHVRPRYQRGSRIYLTCGIACAEIHAAGSVGICDYCRKRPKAVMNGKTYPQCGKTCRDLKAKFAQAATNAAVCTSCVLCWKSTKVGQSDFCSQACQSLADGRAPFLVEIPRGHVTFKHVADHFVSGWQKSTTQCPTVKRVYMVVMMNPRFNASYEKYRAKIGSNGIFQKRWLVISRECSFGGPGDVEPCSSNKCLLCCIVRSAVNPFNFPEGITTSLLNRAVESYRGGRFSSSSIAALMNVFVGREAEMTPQEVQIIRPLPPPGCDSIHIVEVRCDGSKVDKGDIIVYDGDAVKPLYLISYE